VSDGGAFVLIMAGGTGGHIFPGLAVADCLRRRGVEVRWLGARGAMECQRVPDRGIPLDVVDISGLRGKGAASWLLAPWKVARAVFQAWRLLGRSRPSCAISFGGYAAGPGGLAARMRGIPLLVHEQNRVAGMTNRVLARLAARVLQAFPGTWPEELRPVTCGNPVRREVCELEPPDTRLAGRTDPPRLLVTGGSQGALALNRVVPMALAALPAGLEVAVRHQCGRGRLRATEAAYRDAGVPVGAASAAIPGVIKEPIAAKAAPTVSTVEVSEFIEDMAEAYGWADLIVCRAGALTVSEVAAAGLAAVFVPFPHAVDDHQTRNAEFLVERGAARLLQEAGLGEQALAGTLAQLLCDPSRRLDMARRARAAAVPDSAARVADLCGEFAA
jgi:UDP-N-acetylglucosamine--N-acetylmuramyl-(pentapeptide) pyrophosphoryl-undecaprenol N-acetylglucosamine transferase